MAWARKSDRADLEALLDEVAKPPSLQLYGHHVALLRRHRDVALARCLPLIEGSDRDVAISACVAAIALGHTPDLAVLREGFLSDDGRRMLKAAAVKHAVTRGQSAALLALCESVAAVADGYAVSCALEAAIVQRGHAAASDLAALQRLYNGGRYDLVALTLGSVVDAAEGHLRTEAMALFDRVLDQQPTGQSAMSAMAAFAHRADASHIPRLWRALDETPASDRDNGRFCVLGALTRLRAKGIRKFLLRELDEPYGLFRALDYLMELLRGTADVDAVARLVARAAGLSRSYDESHIARAIGAIGGPDALPLIERRFGGISAGDLADARAEALSLPLPSSDSCRTRRAVSRVSVRAAQGRGSRREARPDRR